MNMQANMRSAKLICSIGSKVVEEDNRYASNYLGNGSSRKRDTVRRREM
jgi:hypothetical protein